MIRKKLNKEDGQEAGDARSDTPPLRKNLQQPDRMEEGPQDHDRAEQTQVSGKPGITGTGDLAGKMIDLFGEEHIGSVRNSLTHLNVVVGDETRDTLSWLSHLLDSYFTEDQIEQLCRHYNDRTAGLQGQQQTDKATIQELQHEIAALQVRQSSLEKTLRMQEESLSESAARSKKSIPAALLIRYICDHLPSGFDHISELLLDDAGDEAMMKMKFVISLLHPLSILSDQIIHRTDNDEENMNRLSGTLIRLLAGIDDLHIVNRREILDTIGRNCSAACQDFLFISPENSLVVDPAIHDVKGLHGTKVKQGFSYAVLRKTSRQTVKLAEITAI